ncbi:MAG: hypothetical protein K1X49_03780 [Saprospiraceae bacterium]|nr:hypothetical protein [Saprospiraceae bacterium]
MKQENNPLEKIHFIRMCLVCSLNLKILLFSILPNCRIEGDDAHAICDNTANPKGRFTL